MRFGLLDALRGIAVLGMVVFHTVFDLVFFGLVSIQLYEGNWLIFQRSIAILFILLSGISLVFAHARHPEFKKHQKGLAILLGCALVVSVATATAFPHYAIVFGVLHFLFVSRLLGLGILQFAKYIPALVFFILGFGSLAPNWFVPFGNAPVGFYLGLPIGFAPIEFVSFDYYPLFPWIGIFFLGMGIGTWLSHNRICLPALPSNPFIQVLELVGRHALFVYIVHQIFIIGVIYILFFLVRG